MEIADFFFAQLHLHLGDFDFLTMRSLPIDRRYGVSEIGQHLEAMPDGSFGSMHTRA